MFSTPGYPLSYIGEPIYGVENPRMLASKGDGPLRGVPWGHTVVIRGRLIDPSAETKDKTDDPESGPEHKDLWISSSSGEGPYPNTGYAKVAKTKKKGKFITFLRNNNVSYSSKYVNGKLGVLFSTDPWYLTLIFPAAVEGVRDMDQSYKQSNRDTVYYHTLTHRTSISVKSNPPDKVAPGQTITFTATLRDEDGIFMREGIAADMKSAMDFYERIQDFDSIDLTVDPLASILNHKLEGKIIHFDGTGIVPLLDEKGQPITTATTHEQGVATFTAKAPPSIGSEWTYQAYYLATDNNHSYIENPNKDKHDHRTARQGMIKIFFMMHLLL
jgi:hypothetical protein